MKKITGDAAADHYEWVHPITGEIYRRAPEYVTMSRRPGIGCGWFEKYHPDVFPHDHVVINGVPCHPPRYYDTLYDVLLEGNMDKLKGSRIQKSKLHTCDNTQRRLKDREEVQTSRATQLKRTL